MIPKEKRQTKRSLTPKVKSNMSKFSSFTWLLIDPFQGIPCLILSMISGLFCITIAFEEFLVLNYVSVLCSLFKESFLGLKTKEIVHWTSSSSQTPWINPVTKIIILETANFPSPGKIRSWIWIQIGICIWTRSIEHLQFRPFRP